MIHAKDVAALVQLDCDGDSGLSHSEEATLDLLLLSDCRFVDEWLSLAAGPCWRRRRDRMGREELAGC